MARIAMLLANPFTHDARVERQARTLVGMGHEVTVFCVAATGLPPEDSIRGIGIRRLPAPAWLGWTGPRRAVPFLRWYSRYEFLTRAAAAWCPNVVHGHDLELLHSAGRLAAHLGVPLVYDDHELGLEKLGQGSETLLSGLRKRIDGVVTGELRRRGSTVESRWIPRAVAVFAGSPLYAGVLEERYRRKVTPLLNVPWRSALPPDPRLRSEAQLPPAAKVALYQGTITPGGGGQQCIHAARSFPPGWYLVFLGVTWMRDRLGALAKEAGVEDRVRFLKAVPPIELPGWTRAADIGLAPIRAVNLGQEYSLANKVFEYLHAGLPIVSSDIRGQAALVRELDAGVVLAEVTPESIASAVNLLARIPDSERRATSERLRSVAETRYCWEIESEKLVTEYQRSVFAGPGGVPGGTTDPKR